MITAPGASRIPRLAPPREDPQAAPAEENERHAQLCTHCGAIGTHYLTCASLRLPEGYRPGSDTAVPSRTAGSRLSSGPDHPDWPLPPQG